MLLTKEVEVNVYGGKYTKLYESKGYNIPKVYYCGKYHIPKDTIISVKVEDLPINSKKKVLVKCDFCGKEYYIPYISHIQQTKIRDGKNCCRKCYFPNFASGENSCNWNPNISDDKRQERKVKNRHIPNYNDFVKNVLFLSNYKCMICGSKNELVVHHLDGYSWCEEKRTDISNGVCLCDRCHKTFHSQYGYDNNTKQQFEEWIGCEVECFDKSDKIDFSTRKVVCLETLTVYNSTYECNRLCLLNNKQNRASQVASCCDRKGTCYGYHFVWYNDYINMSDKEITDILSKKTHANPKKGAKVVCIEDKIVFSSIINALNYINNGKTVDPSALSKHLRGLRQQYKGKHYCYIDKYIGDVSELEKVGDGW